MFIGETVIRRYAFLLADIVCIVVSLVLANYLRFGQLILTYYNNVYLRSMGAAVVVACLSCVLFDLDKDLFERGWFEELFAIGKLYACVLTGFLIFLYFAKESARFSRLQMIYFSILFMILDFLVHQILKTAIVRSMKNSGARKRILLVTTSDKTGMIFEQMTHKNNWYFMISGIVLLDEDRTGEEVNGIPVIANADNMIDACRDIVLDGVFLNVSYDKRGVFDTRSIMHEFRRLGVVVLMNVDAMEMDRTANRKIENLGFFKVVSYADKLRTPGEAVAKRAIDVAGAVTGLVITAVLSVFLIPAIVLESPGSPFYSQVRVGRNGRQFKIYKFRSMVRDADEKKGALLQLNEMKGNMFKVEDDPRITRVGHFIRRHSIDEMPQFLNVLKGDMSLVGTRPPTVDEFERYSVDHKRRLSMVPGLTGMWQVNGRSDVVDFEEVVRMDTQYIENWSLLLDAQLLFKTVGIVITGRGAR